MMVIVDLSHPLEHGQDNFPFDPKLSITVHNTVSSIGYNITQICMSTHQGTHVDAPFHFYDDGKTVDQIPLERFYGPATLIDLAPGSTLPPRSSITVAMLQEHEHKFLSGGKIIYRTGWCNQYGRPNFFSDFPSLTLEAAQWIADHRISLLGMDTPTPSTNWKEVHWVLLDNRYEILLVEGLANLDHLPECFTFAAFPLNIKGRDGSPIRAVAIIEGGG